MPVLTMEQFMGHSARGGKRNFLKSWKDKDPYSIIVWLHTRASILAIWRHRFVRVVRREVEGKTKVEIWSDNLVCWEDEETLQAQGFYDRETRTHRDKPPQLCGHCLLTEWIFQEIKAKRLDWREPLFKFEGEDASRKVWFHAGGMCNAAGVKGMGMFGDRELSAERKKMMVEIPTDSGGPVYQRSQDPRAQVAFKQDTKAKLEYVFSVVDNAEVGKGVQVAVESNLLGLKVQGLIADAIKSARAGGRPELGNPSLHPYAIMFEHNPADGIPFDKKYSAVRMEHVRITPAIKKLIVDDPAPDVSGLGKRFDPNTHLANLERHCVHAPTRDKLASFFEASRAEWKRMAASQPQGEASHVPDVGRQLPPPPPPAAPADDPNELVRCNAATTNGPCPHVMKMSDPKCAVCGKVYVIEADPIPLPPPMRTRSEAAQQPARSFEGLDERAANNGDEDDQIPF